MVQVQRSLDFGPGQRGQVEQRSWELPMLVLLPGASGPQESQDRQLESLTNGDDSQI